MSEGTRYYNKTRGPITVVLRDGSLHSFPPKKWSEPVPSRLEGSSDLVQKCRKNLLKRESPKAPEPEPPKEEATKTAKPAKSVPAPATVLSTDTTSDTVEPESEPAGTTESEEAVAQPRAAKKKASSSKRSKRSTK